MRSITMKNPQICRPDGTVLAEVKDATITLPVQQEVHPLWIGDLTMSGTFTSNTLYKRRVFLIMTGVKRKSKTATMAALQRMGMTKAQAKAWMHR